MAKYRKIRYLDEKGEVRCMDPPAYRVKDAWNAIRIELKDSVRKIPKDRVIENTEYEEECFISTAVYGTHSAEQLDTLRDFRDGVMKTNLLGERLLEHYYRISPGIADKIAGNENIKKRLRGMLNFSVSLIEKRGNSTGTLKAFYSVMAVVGYIGMCLTAKILVKRRHGKEKNP